VLCPLLPLPCANKTTHVAPSGTTRSPDNLSGSILTGHSLIVRLIALDSDRGSFGNLRRLLLFSVRKRLDAMSFIKVQDTIEDLRGPGAVRRQNASLSPNCNCRDLVVVESSAPCEGMIAPEPVNAVTNRIAKLAVLVRLKASARNCTLSLSCRRL
jgi:hypothetical protein